MGNFLDTPFIFRNIGTAPYDKENPPFLTIIYFILKIVKRPILINELVMHLSMMVGFES